MAGTYRHCIHWYQAHTKAELNAASNTLTQLAVFIGRHQQDQNKWNGKRITRKWPLDLSSTANEVRAFRTVLLFDVFDLIWVECA